MDAGFDIEVFFDGECPLCRREIALLRRWDRRGRIRFTDIAAEGFSETEAGVGLERLMAEIHARLPDGSWIRGIEALRRVYTAVGLRWFVALSRWPGISRLLDSGYKVFARNRLRWTGRCNAACGIKT